MKYLIPFILISIGVAAVGQSRSNLGIGFDLNKPYSSEYGVGYGYKLEGSIAIGNKWAISPALGEDFLKSKTADGLGPGLRIIGNAELLHLGLSIKYCFTKQWFIKAGALFYAGLGNDNLENMGVGYSAAIGYNLDLDPYNTFEFSLGTHVVNIKPDGIGTTAIAGLRIAYLVNFKKAK